MAGYSTGPIANNPVNGVRPTQNVLVKLLNPTPDLSTTVLIQGYYLNGTRTQYVSELFNLAPNQVITRSYSANFNGYQFVFTAEGDAQYDVEISVWGRNSAGGFVPAHRLVPSELYFEYFFGDANEIANNPRRPATV
ncbi:hypothetical protein ACQ0QQ_10190 [Lysinibacillus sphaericus]